MQDNLGGDFKEFQSAYEAVGTDLFDQQEGSLRKLTQTATQYVLRLDGWFQKNKGLATTIGVVVGGALALLGRASSLDPGLARVATRRTAAARARRVGGRARR